MFEKELKEATSPREYKKLSKMKKREETRNYMKGRWIWILLGIVIVFGGAGINKISTGQDPLIDAPAEQSVQFVKPSFDYRDRSCCVVGRFAGITEDNHTLAFFHHGHTFFFTLADITYDESSVELIEEFMDQSQYCYYEQLNESEIYLYVEINGTDVMVQDYLVRKGYAQIIPDTNLEAYSQGALAD